DIPGEWLALSLALACRSPSCRSWLLPFKPSFVALFLLTSPVLYQAPSLLLHWVSPWPVSAQPGHAQVLTQRRRLKPVLAPSPRGPFPAP
ncbi:hypothetical protein MRX96_052348, partial [Rhipicephalus microplus]